MARRLTLTFDNGPLPAATDRMLDILADRGVRASFFLVGSNLLDPAGRALAERAHREGHWIGNHTMRHIVPLGLSEDPDHVEKELAEADRAIGALHHPDRFIRPPGRKGFGPHMLSRAAFDYCVTNRMTIVTATNIPRDGDPPPGAWVERVLAATRQEEWTVTIMHDRHLALGMAHLERLIDRARAEGLEIVQEFPESVLPMVRGDPRHPIESFVTLAPPLAAGATG